MGYAMALLCAFSFSLYYVFVQKGMKQTKDNGVFVTLLVNCGVLTVAFIISQIFNPTMYLLSGPSLFYFVLAGLFTTFFGRMSLTSSFRYIGSNRSVAIKNGAPFFTVLSASIFLGETLSLVSWFACILIMLGIYYLIFQQLRAERVQSQQRTNHSKYGYLLALFAAFFFGTGDTIRKLGMEEINDPILGVFIGVSVSTFCMFLLQLKGGAFKTGMGEIRAAFNKYYIIAGILSSVAMLSFFVSIQYIQVIYASILVGLEPVITVFLVSVLLKSEDKVNKQLFMAIALVFIGTVILIFSP